MAFGNNQDDVKQKPDSLYSVKASWKDGINWNYVLYAAWAIMVIMLLVMVGNRFKYKKTLVVATQTQLTWSQRADRAQSRINHGIIIPSKKAGNLTIQEGKTVKFLTDLFTDVSTYNSQASYAQARKDAKQVVADPEFFKVFFPSDVTKEGSYIDSVGIKSTVNDVYVYPMGGTHYIVVLSATPYHDDSDLYQQKKLTSNNYVFDVNSTSSQVQKCQPLTDFGGAWNDQLD